MVLANMARRFAGVLAAVAILLAGCADDASVPAKSATGDVAAQGSESKKDEKSVAKQEGTSTIVLAVSGMT